MKKRIGLIAMLVVAGLANAATQEWNFYSDPAGTLLRDAHNSAGTASFTLRPGSSDSALRTDGTGNLVSVNEDAGSAGMWTNGALLNAVLPSPVSSGVQYLRYDFSYDLTDSDGLNDSGCVVGFSFYDSNNDKIVGVALQYDVGASTNTPYQLNELAEVDNTAGSVAVLAKVDLDAKTLDVWYNLSGETSGFVSSAPMHTVSNLALTSFDSLGFQATGDVQPAGSTDRVEVHLLRTADDWAGAVASAPEAPSAKYSNEWTFERDLPGHSLAQAINSGTNSSLAQFTSGFGSTVYTTNRALLCVGEDAGTDGVWTNGAILNAPLPSASTGVHYLRYDVDYDLSSSSNDSGTVLGVYFTGDAGDKAAGLILGYDIGNLESDTPAGRTLTAITNGLPLIGKLTAVAEVDLDADALKVWYTLDGSSPSDYSAHSFTTNIALTSITNLRFHATGDFRPNGTDDYAAVDNIRHTAGTTAGGIAWSEIAEPVVDLTAPPVLSASVSDTLAGSMNLGETNLVTVVISNSGGPASEVTSILTHNGASSAFTVVSNNAPIATLTGGASVSNTYQVVANERGNYIFSATALSLQTNSAPQTLDVSAGANLTFLPEIVTEVSGGVYSGLYEPGEILNITIITTNDGVRAVSNIVNTLTSVSTGFTIAPASATYPSLSVGESTSTVYQVTIGSSMPNGTYLFNVSNTSGSLVWTNQFSLDVFTRQPGADWVKANNTNDLNEAGSWVNEVVPDASDRAVMDQTVTAPITTRLGADLSWRGISLVSNTASWAISGTNTLTTGSWGIDMSQAQANLTVSAPLTLSATQTWDVATSRTLTVSGPIQGDNNAPIIKSGAGSLVVTNTGNNFRGDLTVHEGTLSVGNNHVLGRGLISLEGSSLTTVSGTLLTNSVVLTDSVVMNHAHQLTLSGPISGTGSLTKSGSGTLILGGENTYSGGTTNSGVIEIKNPRALGTGIVVMNAGSELQAFPPSFSINSPLLNPIDLVSGTVTFTNVTGSGGLMVLNGDISGEGALRLGGYQFYLQGKNTFSGGLLLGHNNWLRFGKDALGTGPLTTTRNALLLALESAVISNSISMNHVFRMHSSGQTVQLTGPMSGTGQFQLIDNSAGIVEVSGNNSGRTGLTLHRSGGLRIGHPNAIGSGELRLEPNINFRLEVSRNLTGPDRLLNNVNINDVYYDLNNNNITYPLILNLDYDFEFGGNFVSALLEGGQVIEKNGPGALIFSGSFTANRPVRVTAGSLVISNSTFDSEQISIANGASLATAAGLNDVIMGVGTSLEILNPAIAFSGDLSIGSGSLIKLPVNNTASALRGAGGSLTLAGSFLLDFSANSSVGIGDSFTVITGWGSVFNNGLDVISSGLPDFMKLDTTNLFIDGTVTIVESRLQQQSLRIVVPAGGSASATAILTNPTASTLSFSVQSRTSGPAANYVVTTQNVARTSFPPYGFSPQTEFSSWFGSSTSDMEIGFEMPVLGKKYASFSVSQSGFVILKPASGNGGVTISPFRTTTSPFNQTSVRYKKSSGRLIIAWGNATSRECQVWLNSDGTIQYLYQYGNWGTGFIGIQESSFSQTIAHIPGKTGSDSLLLTPSTWVTNDPEHGTLNAGGIQAVVFTANAENQVPGEFSFTAPVVFGSGQVDSLGVFVTVTPQAPKLDVPSPFVFSGPAGASTQANLVITNSGNSALSYTITDSGLQGAGYSATNAAYSWSHIPAVSTSIINPSQLGSSRLNIGFPFVFFGNVNTSVVVHANGTLSFNDESIISPFAAPLLLDSNASVRFSALSDRFIVTWENVQQTGGSADQTFQSVLNRDGSIRFNYQQLGNGWTNGAVYLADPGGRVSGSLVNSKTSQVSTNYMYYTNSAPPIVIGNVTFLEKETVTVVGTNLVTTYTPSANQQSLLFTPGQSRIISASPVSGTIPAGGTTDIRITGDAGSLRSGGTNDVINSTTLVFTYSGVSTNALVSFIATNSVQTAYPPIKPIALSAALYSPVDIHTQLLNDWVVYDGKLQSEVLKESDLQNPVIRKESGNVILAVNTKKSQTNGLLVVWSKVSGTNYVADASLTVYTGSSKMKNEDPVAAKSPIALILNVENRSASVLLGTSTWSGKYRSPGDLSSEKLSVSFAGRTLKWFNELSEENNEEGHGVASLRYNQPLSDAMNAEAADIAQVLGDYITGKTGLTGFVPEDLEKIQ